MVFKRKKFKFFLAMMVSVGALLLYQNSVPSTNVDAVKYFRIRAFPQDWENTPIATSLNNYPIQNNLYVQIQGNSFIKTKVANTLDSFGRIKFYGMNLSYSANFPKTDSDATSIANGLKNLGVNLVRIISIDTSESDISVEDNTTTIRGIFRTDHSINPIARDRLKKLISKLKTAGIYVSLVLRTGWNIDQVRNPFQIIDPASVRRQKDYSCTLLSELELNNSSSLAMVEINNESSLIDGWHSLLLEDKNIFISHLPLDKRSDAQNLFQKFGDSNASSHSEERKAFVAFLADLDKKYFEDMRTHIRGCTRTLGLLTQVPLAITGTQVAFGNLINKYSNQNMDYLDNHVYFDHPSRFDSLSRFRNDSLTLNNFGSLSSIALFRDISKPFVISEFNESWPNENGHEVSTVMTAMGLVQDWDAIVQFNYMNSDEISLNYPRGLVVGDRNQPSAGFNLFGDPSRLANIGQMTALQRAVNIPTSEVSLINIKYPYDFAKNLSQFVDSSIQTDGTIDYKYHKQYQFLNDTKTIFSSQSDKDRWNDIFLNNRVSSIVGPNLSQASLRIPPTLYGGVQYNPNEWVKFNPQDRSLNVVTPFVLATTCAPTVQGLPDGSNVRRCGNDRLLLDYEDNENASPTLASATFSGARVFRQINSMRNYLLTLSGPSYRILKNNSTGSIFREKLALIDNINDSYKLINPDNSPNSWNMNNYSLDDNGVVIRRDKVKLKINVGAENNRSGLAVKIFSLDGHGVRQCSFDSGTVDTAGYISIDLTSSKRRATLWYEVVLGSDAQVGNATVANCENLNLDGVAFIEN